MYTPPVFVVFAISGSTHWNVISLDTKLSDRKKPPGSEKSDTIRQNTSSLRRSGIEGATTREPRESDAPPKTAMSVRLAATWLRRLVRSIGRESPWHEARRADGHTIA